LFLFVLFITLAAAYPSEVLKKYLSSKESVENMKRIVTLLDPILTIPTVTEGVRAFPGNDTSHKFKRSKVGQQRGPCPGLNLLANYNCIPRNGIATLSQLIWGQMECLGLAFDSAAVLAVTGVGLCGDPRTQKLSIGGPDSDTNPLLYFGQPACGLSNCTNSFEIDMSIAYDDRGLHNGDSLYFNSDRWKTQKAIADNRFAGEWSYGAITEMRDFQYNECVKKNKDCTTVVFTTIGFNMGQNLVNRIMPPADPFGKNLPALYEYIAPFFAVTQNSDGTYSIDRGNEQLVPRSAADPHWYRRYPPLSLEEMASVGLFTLANGKPSPHLPGRNNGVSPDTWVLDPFNQPPSNLTPNSLLCFFLTQVTQQASCIVKSNPNLLSPLTLTQWLTTGLNQWINLYCHSS